MIVPSLRCALCDAFVAREASAGRSITRDKIAGQPALAIPDAYPELHYGFTLDRRGNRCPTCGRLIVVLEVHPRSQASVTLLAVDHLYALRAIEDP